MVGVSVATDVVWEGRAQQHLDFLRVNVGRWAVIPLFNTNPMTHLEQAEQRTLREFCYRTIADFYQAGHV